MMHRCTIIPNMTCNRKALAFCTTCVQHILHIQHLYNTSTLPHNTWQKTFFFFIFFLHFFTAQHMAENIFFLYFFLYFFTAQHMAENISNMHNSRSILHIQPVCNTHNMFTTHNTYHTLYRRKHMEYIQSPFAFCTPLALASVKLPLNLQTRNFKD